MFGMIPMYEKLEIVSEPQFLPSPTCQLNTSQPLHQTTVLCCTVLEFQKTIFEGMYFCLTLLHVAPLFNFKIGIGYSHAIPCSNWLLPSNISYPKSTLGQRPVEICMTSYKSIDATTYWLSLKCLISCLDFQEPFA